jgi:hypothetical protein
VIPLAHYSTNISFDFLSLLASLLIYVKASNVGCKLSLNYSDRHLSLNSNAYLKGISLNASLLYILRQPVVSLYLTILLLEVRGDHSIRGGLVKKDLAEQNNLSNVV